MVTYPMTDEEVEQILQDIIEMAHLIGFSSAMAQSKDGAILGMYIGEPDWIRSKIGNNPTNKPTH